MTVLLKILAAAFVIAGLVVTFPFGIVVVGAVLAAGEVIDARHRRIDRTSAVRR